jgi:DNA-directed RNA polymerase specialized sigma24 family protein
MTRRDLDPGDDVSAWYGTTFPRVRAAVTLAVGDAWLAGEATAQAYARALARWPAVRALNRPGAWVYTVALNHVRSRLRRARLEQRYLARQRAGYHPPPPEPDTALWAAVAKLPPRSRTAVAPAAGPRLPATAAAGVEGCCNGTGPGRRSACDQGRSCGAGDRDRTGMTSLEGWGSAIELHPRDHERATRGPSTA